MLRILPEAVEPDRWTLAFHRTSPHWWVRLLACGRYKHVSAFAYMHELRLWLLYDVTLSGLRLLLLPDSGVAVRHLAEHARDADLVRMPRRHPARPPLAPYYCVPAIAHLVGARGALLRPDGLWRYCLAHGGEVISHGASEPAQPGDRSGYPAASTAS